MSGGSKTPTSTTSVTQNFSPEEAAQRAKVMDEAAKAYNATAGTISSAPYPGAKPVPFSPETQAAQTMMLQSAGPMQQNAQNASAYSNWLMGPAQYAEANPYLQSAINAAVRPVTQNFTQAGGTQNQVRNNAQGAGQYGSTRQGIAEGIVGRGYLDTVGDIGTKMAYQNYSDAQQAGGRALMLAPQTGEMLTQPAMATAAVGQQKELLGQAMEDYSAQGRYWDLNAPWAPLNNYANIVFGGASPGTTSTSTGSVAQQSRFTSGLSMAAAGASLGSAVMPGVGTAVGAGLGLLAGLFA